MIPEQRAQAAAEALSVLARTCPAEAGDALKVLAEEALDAARLRDLLGLARLAVIANLDLNTIAARRVLLALDDEIESLHQVSGW